MATISSCARLWECRQGLTLHHTSQHNTRPPRFSSAKQTHLLLHPAPVPLRWSDHQTGEPLRCLPATSTAARSSSRRGGSRAVVSLSLPQARWSARAIKTFGMAELEARKLKYPTTGTEALLMGMLTEGTSLGSIFLRSKGVKLFELRDETVKLLGKADMYYFSAEHPPLTPPAEAALKWAIDEHQRRGGEGEISTELILLGIWEQKEAGAGHRLLANLGFTDADANELRELISKTPATV